MASNDPPRMPSWRNLGVMLRAALLAEAVRAAALFTLGGSLGNAATQFLTQGVLYEPVLLTVLALLWVASPRVQRLPYRRGVAVVLAVATSATLVWDYGLDRLSGGPVQWPAHILTSWVVSGVVLFYFDWRHYRLSPALTEARLLALQSRIRPHFLFNSLNSVLALVRLDPSRAEAMLQDLSDLYRALLSDARALVPLAQELASARAYVDIEVQRFGDRLRVHWLCDHAPLQAMVPPLLLQPLLENAVHYGVEPSEGGADITVEAYEDSGQLLLFVRNPVVAQPEEGAGQHLHLALANITERLDLHFDAEARLKAGVRDGEFVVSVRLPLTSSPRPAKP